MDGRMDDLRSNLHTPDQIFEIDKDANPDGDVKYKGFDPLRIATIMSLRCADQSVLIMDINALIALCLNQGSGVVEPAKLVTMKISAAEKIADLVRKYVILPRVPENLDPALTSCVITLDRIAATYPSITMQILSNHPDLERPISNMTMKSLGYENFPAAARTNVIFSAIPKGGTWGGLVKVCLIYQREEIKFIKGTKNDQDSIMDDVITYARAFYSSTLLTNPMREAIFADYIKAAVNETTMLTWTTQFDKEYPALVNIHTTFGQII